MRRLTFLTFLAVVAVLAGVVVTAVATAPAPAHAPAPARRRPAVASPATVPPRRAALSVAPDAGWCGGEESSIDRPDAVAGAQIHVIYAYPPGGEDHFDQWAPRITQELAAAEQWWRSQDPTRGLRFDLAAFPGCTAPLGSLDISSVELTRPAGDFFTPTGSRSDIFRTALGPGFERAGKIDLVFLDADDPNHRACGVDTVAAAVVFLDERARCPSFATAATHELLHALGAVFGTSTLSPHACDDRAHVCDRDDDILARGQVGPETLASAVLDVGRDDYYGNTGRSYDVRSSPYLRHLDTPQVHLTLSVSAGNGFIGSTISNLVCPPTCGADVDAGTRVSLNAVAKGGDQFVAWGGACTQPGPRASTCILVLQESAVVTVAFGSPPSR